ncbi:MAG: hypothetical protein CVU39_02540 [Chloroflexi bacterium HGW-Chloroflexi-10]|nr:MAG: hypothetical protein CVU39_02540 [Chloroflexi bacterium HGW-Chloroflexi-10]
MDFNQTFVILSLVLLVLGAISFFSGLIVLLTRVLGGGINKIAAETKKIVQKGIAEEMAGLVGNASVLIESVNQLVKTAAGIGVFLMVIGLIMMTGAIVLLMNLH